MKSLVILVSGRGSNLYALLAAHLPGRVAGVLANLPGIPALDVARQHGVPAQVIDHTRFASREAFDRALAAAVDAQTPDFVVLAGFMRVLSGEFVERYAGRMVNIHPSLLPAFPGLATHRQALAAGVRLHGCTVHFVTPHVDHGPIIAQAAVPVLPDDDEATLAARVLAQEHRLYPAAVRWLLEGRAKLAADGRVSLTGLPESVYPSLLCPNPGP